MMVVQKLLNVFEGAPAPGAPSPRQSAGSGTADSFLSTLEGFLALQESGYDLRRTGEAALGTGKAGEETLFERRRADGLETAAGSGDVQSVSAAQQGLARPAAVRQEASRPAAARQETSRPAVVREDVPRPEVLRPYVVRRGTALPGDRHLGDFNLRDLDLRFRAFENRNVVEKPGVESNARARAAGQSADTGRKAGFHATEASSDHKKSAGGSFAGALSEDRPAGAIRSAGKPRPEGIARTKGGQQPGNTAGSPTHETGASGAGKSTADALLSALKRAGGNAVYRVKESDRRNEGDDRGSEAQARVASRGVLKNAPDGLRAHGQQARPAGISGISGISMKNSLSELTDAKSDEGKARAGDENRRGFGEITLAASKYESTALRALAVPDYQISRNTDEFINEIVRQFTLVARKGGGEAHISLKPDFLGGMKLNLRLNNGEVSSFILVDNPAVKDLIMSRLTVLEQGLLQHGLSLGSFQVEVKDGGSRAQTEGQAEGHDGRQSMGASIETGRVEEAVASAVPAGAGLPWMSTVVNVTV
jgi:hypothetical protein